MQNATEDIEDDSVPIALPSQSPTKEELPEWFYDCFFGVFTGYAGCYYSDMTARASLATQPIPEQLEPPKREVRINELLFKAVRHSHDCFLGKLHRDAITGSIIMEDVRSPEPFEYIDLAGRTQVKGTVQEILRDDRIFKAEPLVLRSWLYQNIFDIHTSSRVRESHMDFEEEGPLRSLNTIRERSLTLPVEQFESRLPLYYSPSIAVLLSVAVASFSLDKSVFVILLLLWILTVIVSQRTNTYSAFRRERIITLVFRSAVAAWIVSLGLKPYIEYFRPVNSTMTPCVLRMVAGTILAADIIFGDIRQILIHPFLSERYRIRKIFPSNPRVFLCEKNDTNKPGATLPEWINPDKSDRIRLVVDIHGILHLLHPLSEERDLPNPILTSKAIPMASIQLLP